jgi:putative hydrolase of the HAD superfamily
VIRAVTFDCWGTLLLDSPAADEGYRRQRVAGMATVLARHGIDVPGRALDEAYAAAGRRLARLWQANRDVSARGHVLAVLDAVDDALARRLSDAVVDELLDAYASPALRVPPAVDAGAAAAVAALTARGCALGVVSNTMRTPGAALRRVLDRAGLLAPFAAVTFSDECGIRKPDPEIFARTLRAMGVAPADAVHVGDDPVLDVEGARDAGMRVIQVASGGRATGPVKPDAAIAALGELPDALAGLGA